MKGRIYILFLIISSLFCYLEWGTDQSYFLFQMEWQVIQEIVKNPAAFLHPFVAIPFIGQLLLITALFSKTPKKKLVYVGMIGIAVIVLMILLVSIISGRYAMSLSTIPYFMVSTFSIRFFRKN